MPRVDFGESPPGGDDYAWNEWCSDISTLIGDLNLGESLQIWVGAASIRAQRQSGADPAAHSQYLCLSWVSAGLARPEEPDWVRGSSPPLRWLADAEWDKGTSHYQLWRAEISPLPGPMRLKAEASSESWPKRWGSTALEAYAAFRHKRLDAWRRSHLWIDEDDSFEAAELAADSLKVTVGVRFPWEVGVSPQPQYWRWKRDG